MLILSPLFKAGISYQYLISILLIFNLSTK
nr:MAG TPA: hypothetical protein [Caudoviricetes sp.]